MSLSSAASAASVVGADEANSWSAASPILGHGGLHSGHQVRPEQRGVVVAPVQATPTRLPAPSLAALGQPFAEQGRLAEAGRCGQHRERPPVATSRPFRSAVGAALHPAAESERGTCCSAAGQPLRDSPVSRGGPRRQIVCHRAAHTPSGGGPTIRPERCPTPRSPRRSNRSVSLLERDLAVGREMTAAAMHLTPPSSHRRARSPNTSRRSFGWEQARACHSARRLCLRSRPVGWGLTGFPFRASLRPSGVGSHVDGCNRGRAGRPLR